MEAPEEGIAWPYGAPDNEATPPLYVGDVIVGAGGDSAKAVVRFRWDPAPRVVIELAAEGDDALMPVNPGRVDVRFPDPSIRTTNLLLASVNQSVSVITGDSFNAEGVISHVEVGKRKDLSALVSQVANLPPVPGDLFKIGPAQFRGRSQFRFRSWLVTLDQVERAKANLQALKSGQSFRVTHLLRIERHDGKLATATALCAAMAEVGDLLSFVRGAWCHSAYAVGLDANGSPVFWSAGAPKLDPGYQAKHWYPFNVPTSRLASVAPRFLRVVRKWKAPGTWIVSWYVEANRNPSSEVGLTLAQAGLEALAWQLLAADGQMTAEAFQKEHADKLIVSVLKQLTLSDDLPSGAVEFAAGGKKFQITTASKAVTQVRNAIVHPNSKPTRQWVMDHPSVRHEAAALAVWVLAICLLRCFDYKGDYANRMAAGGIALTPFPYP